MVGNDAIGSLFLRWTMTKEEKAAKAKPKKAAVSDPTGLF
jgi:hypothetical protein